VLTTVSEGNIGRDGRGDSGQESLGSPSMKYFYCFLTDLAGRAHFPGCGPYAWSVKFWDFLYRDDISVTNCEYKISTVFLYISIP
jgi:hypothetical protein